MGPQFFETQEGRKFYEGTVPELINAINNHTEAVKRQTEAMEKQTELLEKLMGKLDTVE